MLAVESEILQLVIQRNGDVILGKKPRDVTDKIKELTNKHQRIKWGGREPLGPFHFYSIPNEHGST